MTTTTADTYQIHCRPHRGPWYRCSISASDVAAIKRWEADGSLTEVSLDYDLLSDEQKADVDVAVAWSCHDLNGYTITNA